MLGVSTVLVDRIVGPLSMVAVGRICWVSRYRYSIVRATMMCGSTGAHDRVCSGSKADA